MSAKAAGGLIGVVLVAGLVGVRVYLRHERNQARDERQHQQASAMPAESLKHAHEMMNAVNDDRGVQKYLHTAVDSHHETAVAASDYHGPTYRDALLDAIFAQAQKEGREDAMRALEKLRLYSRAAGSEWWKISRKI